jgi:E3 ubiquitin-protein ligase SIAH1
VEDPDALESSDAATPPPPPSSRVRPESAAAALGGVTVEDTDALDCGVCFLPLKPPIFQVRTRTTLPLPMLLSVGRIDCRSLTSNQIRMHSSMRRGE